MDNGHRIENNGADEQANPSNNTAQSTHAVPAHPAEPIIYDATGAVVVHPEEEARIKAEKAAEEIKTSQKTILDRIKTGERLMIFFTAIVALTTVAQFFQSRSNNTSTSMQVDKIIDAANIQGCAANRVADASKRSATAAEGFADSANKINGHMKHAVNDFETSSNSQLETMRNQLKVFEDAQAAQLVFDQFDVQVDGLSIKYKVVISNVGSTAAKNVVILDFARYREPDGRIHRFPIKIDDTSGVTIGQGRSKTIENTVGITEDILKLSDSTPAVGIAVEVAYKDIFGREFYGLEECRAMKYRTMRPYTLAKER